MNSITDLLSRFGFSKNEARVYIALMQEASATGYQISKTTGISRAEVYRVLSNLADKGAVVWQQTEPVFYMAVDPESYLAGLEAQFHRDLKQVREELKDINRQKSSETIVYIKGYDHMLRRVKDMISTAKHELYIRCGSELVALVQEDVKQVFERGVKVRILSYGDIALDIPGVIIHPLRHDEVHRHRVSQMLMISDIQHMLTGQMDSQSPTSVIGTYSENREIIHTIREMMRASFHLTILGNESELITQYMKEHELFKEIYQDGSIWRYD